MGVIEKLDLTNFDNAVHAEKAYQAECKRIYVALDIINDQSRGRVANKKSFGDQQYLVLRGVAIFPDNDGRQLAKVFAISEGNILYKIFRVLDPSSNPLTNNLENNNELELFSESDLKDLGRIYDGEANNSVVPLQDAINNSIRYAIPQYPKAEKFKQIIV